ncbi:MAG: UPF0149 family protein [Gammaproteobacteria bacterium]|nr:UPF0149 family protein [Gammaproteobacteria bacterium]
MTDTHAFLADFLAAPERPADTLDILQLQGLLFAVCCAPEMTETSDWIAATFADQDPGFTDPEQSRAVFEALVALYNEVNEGVVEDRPALPAGCAFRDDLMANAADDAPVARWAQGFDLGQAWLEEVWDAWLPEALVEDFDADVHVLTFFGAAEAVREELGRMKRRRGRTVEELFAEEAAYCRDTFDTALAAHAALGRKLYLFAQGVEAQREPVRVTKTGRNEPCPCGSGKKYKKCCGA